MARCRYARFVFAAFSIVFFTLVKIKTQLNILLLPFFHLLWLLLLCLLLFLLSFIVLITRVFSRIVSMTVTRRKPLAQSTRAAVVVVVVAAATAAAVCLQNEVVISVLQAPLAPLSPSPS